MKNTRLGTSILKIIIFSAISLAAGFLPSVYAATVVDPQIYAGRYFISDGVNPLIGPFTGTQTFNLAPGNYSLDNGNAVAGSYFGFTVDGSGQVSGVTNAAAAAASGNTLVLNNSTLSVQPGSYTGRYNLLSYNVLMTGPQSYTVIPGLRYGIDNGASIGSATAQSYFYFETGSTGAIANVDNGVAAFGDGNTLRFNNQTLTVSPNGYAGTYNLSSHYVAYPYVSGQQTFILIPGLLYRFDKGTGDFTSSFKFDANGTPTNIQPLSFATGSPNTLTLTIAPPSPVTAASIQRWKVSNGYYALNFFGDGTLLAANEFAVPVPGQPGSGGVSAVKMNPITGSTIQSLVSSDVRSTIRLSNSPSEQDWIIGGWANRPAIGKDGVYIKDLFPLGCCNVPRHPFAYDHINDRGWLTSSGGIGYVHIPTDQRIIRGTITPNSFGGVSLADQATAYTSGQQGYAVKTDAIAGRQWSVLVDTVRLQPGAVYLDGSFIVTSGWAHFEGTPTPGRLARILPSGTLVFNSMINAVTPPVIGGNGLIFVGTQPAPIDQDGAGAIEAYDPETGNLVWSVPVAGLPNDLLVGDDGAVYAATGSFYNGRVYSIGQADGAVRQIITDVQGAWEIVLRAGLLYASGRSQFGPITSITALPVAANNYDLSSPWPVRYHDNQRTSNRTHPILTPTRIPAPVTPTPTPSPGPPCLGAPTFTQMPPVPTSGTYQQGVATGDFDEDGNVDLVFSNFTTSLVSVRFGDGAGGFSGSTDLPNLGSPWGVVVGDFDQDSNLDLAVMSSDSGLVRIWLGNGDGTFNGPTAYNMGARWPSGFDAVDINNDGKIDLLSVNFETNNIMIMYGDGNGAFGAPVNVPVGAGPASAAASDFNGDGITDLASANYYANSISIRIGASGGTFSSGPNFAVGSNPIMVRAAHFNADSFIDLAVTNSNDNTVSILLGDGTGAFTAGGSLPTTATPSHLVIGDLNNDGYQDIVAVPVNSNALSIFLGDGVGGFTPLPGVFTDINSTKVAVGDFNNDGVPDLASGNASGFHNRIIIHLGGCSVPPPTPTPTPTPDTVAPTTSAGSSPAANASGWNNSNIIITLTASDNSGGSGVSTISYSTVGAQTITQTTVGGSSTVLALTMEGQTTISYFATDVTGNVESANSLVVKIDKTAPVISQMPSNRIAEAAGAGGAVVSWTAPSVADALDPDATVACSPVSGSLFAIGTTQVTCTALDRAGNNSSSGFEVRVVDSTPPAIAIVPANISVTATSAAGAAVSWAAPTALDSVDGSVAVVCSPVSGGTFAHGVTTVTCTARDSRNNTSSRQFTVEVRNAPPTANAGGPYSVGEGGSISLSGAGTDIEGTSLVYTWDLDDNGTFETSGQNSVFSAAGLDGPTNRTVKLRVTDGAGLTAVSSATVNVLNVAPTLISISGPTAPQALNSTTNNTLNYTDPAGSLDQYTVTTDWGDGTTTSVLSHVYKAAGVYRVRTTVSDDDGGVSNQGVYEFVVIYDPSAGFVTGGGWIMSGAGACQDTIICGTLDPTGRANFGFNSKYQPGRSVPSGETQFDFKQGNLKFHSTIYEWMVISGSRVQYRGEGTINGAGQYRFVLTATDGRNGAPDKFRIRIMRVGSGGGDGAVVYDNQQGANVESMDAGTVISGGNIMIHTNN